MVNRIWPTAVAGKADSVSSVSASACQIGGPNSVNPGQILLVYGIPCHGYLCCDMWCGDLHALRYHAMNTYALKYGAVIYMLSFTCQRLLAAHSGTHLSFIGPQYLRELSFIGYEYPGDLW